MIFVKISNEKLVLWAYDSQLGLWLSVYVSIYLWSFRKIFKVVDNQMLTVIDLFQFYLSIFMCLNLLPSTVPVSDSVQNRYIWRPLLCLTPPTEGFPWDDLRKNFTEGSHMAKVSNGVETLPKISIAWVWCTNVTDDRQTDRWQTDGRTMTYSERKRSRSLKMNWEYFVHS